MPVYCPTPPACLFLAVSVCYLAAALYFFTRHPHIFWQQLNIFPCSSRMFFCNIHIFSCSVPRKSICISSCSKHIFFAGSVYYPSEPVYFFCGIRYQNIIFQQPYIVHFFLHHTYAILQKGEAVHTLCNTSLGSRETASSPLYYVIYGLPPIYPLNVMQLYISLCSIRLLSCSTCIFFLQHFSGIKYQKAPLC